MMPEVLMSFTNGLYRFPQTFLAGYSLSGVLNYNYCPQPTIILTRYLPQTQTFLGIVYDKGIAQEINAASGTVVNQITMAAINQQLTALGQPTIIDLNHEVMRLPDGSTAILGQVERLYTGVQSPPGVTVDVLGEEIVVVDPTWKNVTWVWDAYNWLPVSRKAILGETVSAPKIPLKLASTANDWLHGNSIYYDPSDGNLNFSMRAQDWVVKISYQNGSGDGHLVWTLGNDGSFTVNNPYGVSSPWFSHQHDVELDNSGNIVLFDNGNTRYATDPTIHSRGQVWVLDTVSMLATLQLSYDMGVYSEAYGTAEQLPNGNYWFLAGSVQSPGVAHLFSRAVEVVPGTNGTGAAAFILTNQDTSYRAPRLAAAP